MTDPSAAILSHVLFAYSQDSDVDEAQAREFANMLLTDQGQRDSVLEMMFQVCGQLHVLLVYV